MTGKSITKKSVTKKPTLTFLKEIPETWEAIVENCKNTVFLITHIREKQK